MCGDILNIQIVLGGTTDRVPIVHFLSNFNCKQQK